MDATSGASHLHEISGVGETTKANKKVEIPSAKVLSNFISSNAELKGLGRGPPVVNQAHTRVEKKAARAAQKLEAAKEELLEAADKTASPPKDLAKMAKGVEVPKEHEMKPGEDTSLSLDEKMVNTVLSKSPAAITEKDRAWADKIMSEKAAKDEKAINAILSNSPAAITEKDRAWAKKAMADPKLEREKAELLEAADKDASPPEDLVKMAKGVKVPQEKDLKPGIHSSDLHEEFIKADIKISHEKDLAWAKKVMSEANAGKSEKAAPEPPRGNVVEQAPVVQQSAEAAWRRDVALIGSPAADVKVGSPAADVKASSSLDTTIESDAKVKQKSTLAKTASFFVRPFKAAGRAISNFFSRSSRKIQNTHAGHAVSNAFAERRPFPPSGLPDIQHQQDQQRANRMRELS